MNRIFLKVRRVLILLTVLGICLLVLWHLLGGRRATPVAEVIGRGKTVKPALSTTPLIQTATAAAAAAVAAAAAAAAAAPAVANGGGKFPLLDNPKAFAAFDRTQPVVRIVHQSWVNATLPPLFARWARTFPKCFPTFQYAVWSDEDNRRLIAEHYPWFLPRYDSYGVGVQKADVSRLFYMYHYGGVYCDLDCECLENFEHILVNTSLAFGAMEGKMIFSTADPQYVEEGQIENSFMYSRPKHPFFWELILQLNSTSVGLPIMTSGPYLIMKGIHMARQNGLDKTKVDGRPYLTIYPPKMFNPYSWIHHNAPQCRLYGEFTEDSLTACRNSFKGSYVLQYHTQVWDKGKSNVLQKVKL